MNVRYSALQRPRIPVSITSLYSYNMSTGKPITGVCDRFKSTFHTQHLGPILGTSQYHCGPEKTKIGRQLLHTLAWRIAKIFSILCLEYMVRRADLLSLNFYLRSAHLLLLLLSHWTYYQDLCSFLLLPLFLAHLFWVLFLRHQTFFFKLKQMFTSWSVCLSFFSYYWCNGTFILIMLLT